VGTNERAVYDLEIGQVFVWKGTEWKLCSFAADGDTAEVVELATGLTHDFNAYAYVLPIDKAGKWIIWITEIDSQRSHFVGPFQTESDAEQLADKLEKFDSLHVEVKQLVSDKGATIGWLTEITEKQ
jgi:hypothetical protein